MDNEALKSWLKAQCIAAAEISGTEGGSILVIDAGARVLRLVGRSVTDFLWLNKPFFDDPRRFAETGWRNYGGDRTWVAPERSLFISDLSDPWGTYEVPKSFDPGSYELRQSNNSVTLSSRFTVTDFALKSETELSIEKKIAPIPNPLRYDADPLLEGVEYIGYEQSTILSLLSDQADGTMFGLWHLAQVEAPGEILVPVTDDKTPHVYFGEQQPDSVKPEPGLLRFAVKGTMLKIGIKADSTYGRAGFIREDGDGLWSLLVRNFNVNPSGEYVDVPWDDPADLGYAVQCFSDDGKLGNFGELEYHAPAIGNGVRAHTDTSQLWAFRAERPVIERIAKRLLAISI